MKVVICDNGGSHTWANLYSVWKALKHDNAFRYVSFVFSDIEASICLLISIQISASWNFVEFVMVPFHELVPIVLALHLLKNKLSLNMIMFHTDNKALVTIVNNKSSKSKRVM
jgi:hypothetical protein